jgi:hypothetical protein
MRQLHAPGAVVAAAADQSGRVVPLRPDIHLQVEEESTEERTKCQDRRARVLAHPDLAALLCEPPFSLANPMFWSGYIPPQYHMQKPNNSPIRKQLIMICQLVAKREEEQANPAPIAPEFITEKQLALLHICLNEYLGEIDKETGVLASPARDEKLMFLSAETDREITTSKELHKDEASRLIDKLTQLVKLEQRTEDEAEPEPKIPPVESTPEPGSGPDPTGWGDDTEPPY